eukprot:TRINITY_DN1375_c0_g1_i2.p1 TRINITY_DN1375_c0_g1~~TRINITY_DN1375_c0_g1_i2.p1  ORF type:complete len:109 (-),score=5.76 TRINITY_DN1375_c0_g1_i2:34-312(-)
MSFKSASSEGEAGREELGKKKAEILAELKNTVRKEPEIPRRSRIFDPTFVFLIPLVLFLAYAGRKQIVESAAKKTADVIGRLKPDGLNVNVL